MKTKTNMQEIAAEIYRIYRISAGAVRAVAVPVRRLRARRVRREAHVLGPQLTRVVPAVPARSDRPASAPSGGHPSTWSVLWIGPEGPISPPPCRSRLRRPRRTQHDR